MVPLPARAIKRRNGWFGGSVRTVQSTRLRGVSAQSSRIRQPIWVLALYAALAAVYTWPLLAFVDTRIAGSGDPLLNAAILWWNATTVPFSAAWWNQPHFYPAEGVTAFTENLLGVSVLASPIYWLTGDPIATYNLSVLVTWPLSALGAHLLAQRLTNRFDVGLIAGIAYGFSVHRPAEIGHLQMLASFWMPFALLGLHAYLQTRSPRWLVLFAAAGTLQSLANSHLMLFGGVLIVLWLLYFCSPRHRWRDAAAIAIAWTIANLPLVAIMLKYRAVHQQYGLSRNLEVIGLSAPLSAWAQVADSLWLWSKWLPDGPDTLFPGLTAPLLVMAGAGAALIERRSDLPASETWRRRWTAVTAVVLAGSVAIAAIALLRGPLHASIAGVSVRVTDLTRPLVLAVVSTVLLVTITIRLRRALERRSPLLFYAAGAIAMGLFAMGPVMAVNDQILFHHAPYRWLLTLPGFTSVRAPSRFWMLGVLCLAIAAGLAYARLRLRIAPARGLAASLIAGGLLLEGWMAGLPMDQIPARAWPLVERAGADQPPLLELPIRELDYSATFRAMGHRRRVVNGVSGYEPPHYDIVVDALTRFDPGILKALASLGAFDAVIDRDLDPRRHWDAFVAAFPGARLIADDGSRAAYRIPAAQVDEPRPGTPLPIRHAAANDGHVEDAVDGRIETGWDNGPQHPGQWMQLDLEAPREVAGVTLFLGNRPRDYPRRLAVDLSIDGITWSTVREGGASEESFYAAVRYPREAPVRFLFAPARARFVRLRQLATHSNLWFIAEVQVHAPAR